MCVNLQAGFYHAIAQGTVGAGLPVLQTLKHLRDTGDKILKIEGIFSGTLSYIFNTFGPGTPFSEVVAAAKANGFTEPDPRDDLEGMDVARKVTILARYAALGAVLVCSNHTLLVTWLPLLSTQRVSVLCERCVWTVHAFSGRLACMWSWQTCQWNRWWHQPLHLQHRSMIL